MAKKKYVDTIATIQILGNLYNNIRLLDNESYSFYKEDFTEEFHQIIYGSLYNLYVIGAREIDVNTIEDYLSQKPKSFAIYESNRGRDYIAEISKVADANIFNYAYNRLKKMTLLRTYDDIGMDVSWLYDPDNILDAKKKQAQEEWLDNTTLEEIADSIDKKIVDIRLKYVDDANESAVNAGKGALALLNRLKETPEIGYPLFGPLINTVTRGARLKKLYLRSAATGVGKALPNSTLIPTPNGFKSVGKIKDGDLLFDAFGKPTKVIKTFPQGEKEVWEVIFEDGRKARCCDEHLWSYCTSSQNKLQRDNRQFNTKTLAEISKMPLYIEGQGYQVLVPMQRAVDYGEKEYSVSPYAFGLMLRSKSLNCVSLEHILTYATGSISQRLDLLRGLLDSEGKIDEKTGNVIYFTNNTNVRDGVISICMSLGYKATYCEDTYNNLNNYKIEISGTQKDKAELFSLQEKKNLILSLENNKEEDIQFNPIVEIRKLEYREEMTCFLVDNEEHLFLMNDYIVTHNTRAMIADACHIACDELYDSQQGKWVSNGTKEPTIFISTEQELEELQTMMIAFISDVDEDHILNSTYQVGEWERVVKATAILETTPLYIQQLPDFSLKDIENTIKKGIRDWNVRYVFFDYLHTSMKILEEVTKRSGGVRLREDNILFMISIRLKDLCNQYGIFIMTATQLSNDYNSAETPDQNLLRGAKSIADKVDMGAIMLEVTQKDRESLQTLLEKSGYEMPDIKMSIYKNRRGRWKGIYLWCKAYRGTCKIVPMFATNYRYEFIPIEEVKINVKPQIDVSQF